MAGEIPYLDEDEVKNLLSTKELIEALRKAFANPEIETPTRHHHQYGNGISNNDSTLLLMPSWEKGKELGVKVVTVSPENGRFGLPSIHGVFLLFNSQTGQPGLIMDARSLTAKRTAATSALASSYLSSKDSDCLLIIGTGYLASYLIEAHASARPIRKVMIWGRSIEKARLIAQQHSDKFETIVVQDLKTAISAAHIISCATLSSSPLIEGSFLQPGQHLDLVGSYRPDMREADDTCIQRSDVYIDTSAALKESGDLFIPIEEGVLNRADIKGDLFQLCSQGSIVRDDSKSITLFKSVGHAMEDLVAAGLAFKQQSLTK